MLRSKPCSIATAPYTPQIQIETTLVFLEAYILHKFGYGTPFEARACTIYLQGRPFERLGWIAETIWLFPGGSSLSLPQFLREWFLKYTPYTKQRPILQKKEEEGKGPN